MKIHGRRLAGWLAVVGCASVLGLAVATSSTAPTLLIPLLVLAIVFTATLCHGRIDVVLGVVTAAAFLLPMNNVRVTTALTVGDVLVVVALSLILTIRLGQRNLRIPGMTGLIVGVILIFGGGLIGSLFALSPGASVALDVKFAAATITLPMLFGLWRPSIDQLRVIAWSTVIGTSVSAFAGIFFIKLYGRAEGLTNHPNHLSLSCVLAVGLALGLGLSSRRRGQLIAVGALLVLSFGILASGSRSGLIGEAVAVAIVGLLTHNRKVILSSLAAVVALAVTISSGLVTHSGSSAVGRFLGGGGAASGDTARVQSLRSAINTIGRYPLTGRGFAAAPPGQLLTHNIILLVASTTGVLGLAGLGIASWVAIRPAWETYRWGQRRNLDPANALLIGTVSAVLGFLIYGLVADQLYDRYIWIVLTMSAAVSYQLRSEDRPMIASPPHPLSDRLHMSQDLANH